jgi:hypothetical protein
MARDRVQELGPRLGVEVAGALLDEPQPEVDVTEQPSLLRLSEDRSRCEVARPPDVVQQGCREQQVVPQPRMELRGLAADRRHADRVLEQAAGVAVMAVGSCRQRPERLPQLGIAHERGHHRRKPRMRDLAGEELEEAVELVRVPP